MKTKLSNNTGVLLLLLGALFRSSDSFVVTNPNLGRNPFLLTPRNGQKTGFVSVARWVSAVDTVQAFNSTAMDKSVPTIRQQQQRYSSINAPSDDTAAMATAKAAVKMAFCIEQLEATVPNVENAISHDIELDEEGLPLVYDKDAIEAYWSKEPDTRNQRWRDFLEKSIPFLTKLTTLFLRDGTITRKEISNLSRQARLDLQDLGPTFVKAGQMVSVRPDVLPDAALDELKRLQDGVEVFDTKVALQLVEKELGGPLDKFFTSISEEPVAAASLAQVYRATLNDGKETKVAIKIQRPNLRKTVSKDLYVLRKAAEVIQGLVGRFFPKQRTNYVSLLEDFSRDFYKELDFINEAQNQQKLCDSFIKNNIKGVMVPKVYHNLCTRKILVSEWIEGKTLNDATSDEIQRVTPIAQEAFLTQMFKAGFFHADPHPGNFILLDEPNQKNGNTLALIDCGLVIDIQKEDRDFMISTVIHTANNDYMGLVEDFIKLGILPKDTDRKVVVPLMDRALRPYVTGGGVKNYGDNNPQSRVGGFQALSRDALLVLKAASFNIPPFFATRRAIIMLEGIALMGDPNYGIIREAYPFVARELLTRAESPTVQRVLQEVLYSSSGKNSNNENRKTGTLNPSRLLALLNTAAGSIAPTQKGAVVVDIDAIPEDGISLQEGLRFMISKDADGLKNLLEPEVDLDELTRQIFRQGAPQDTVV